jgi:hypothetical protein
LILTLSAAIVLLLSFQTKFFVALILSHVSLFYFFPILITITPKVATKALFLEGFALVKKDKLEVRWRLPPPASPTLTPILYNQQPQTRYHPFNISPTLPHHHHNHHHTNKTHNTTQHHNR